MEALTCHSVLEFASTRPLIDNRLGQHMHKTLTLGVAATLGVLAVEAAQADITCTINQKHSCAPQQGCKPVKVTIVLRMDPKSGTYSRCDAKGRDDFEAQFSRSGVFVNIALPKKGLMAKMSVDGSMFLEVATLSDVALVSYGSCK